MQVNRAPPPHDDDDALVERSLRELVAGRPTAEELAALARLRATALGIDEPMLVDRYALRDRVGAGGGGIVYRARDCTLERDVAIKLLGSDAGAPWDDAQLAAAVDEARALAMVRHPNVVDVFDAGIVGGEDRQPQAYVVTEFVHGVTMQQWLTHPQPRARVLALFEQAAQGLAALHRGGLVHGDVKLDNLLLGVDDVVRVCDFGLASGLQPSLAVRSGGGTPGYQAPELERGEAPTHASDQYAFFVALHRALLGCTPERDGTGTTVGNRQGAERALPRALVQTLQRGLSQQPGERFASMDEVTTRLQQLQRRPSPPRRRTLALAATAVALATGGAWLTRDGTRRSAPVAIDDPAPVPRTDPCAGLPRDRDPHPMVPREVPELGQRVRDEAFGSTLVRIATVPLASDRRKDARGVLSWSPDARWLLRRTAEPHRIAIHDGSSYERLDVLDVGFVAWSVERPGVLFDIDRRRGAVEALDVQTGARQVVAELGPCSAGEGWRIGVELSWHDELGVQCDGLGSFVSLSGGERSSPRALELAPQPAPSGALFLLGAEVRNRELAILHYLDLAEEEHATLAVDAEGRDLLVAVAFDPAPRGTGVGSVVTYALRDASETRVVVGPVTGWPYPKSGTRLDAAGPTAPSWVGVRSTGDPAGQTPLDQELMLVDVADGRTCRVAHHRSTMNLALALSPTATRVAFETDWGAPDGPVHVFVAETPAYASRREGG